MSVISAPRLSSQEPLGRFIEKIARLAKAEAIAVLVAEPTDVPNETRLVPAAVYGSFSGSGLMHLETVCVQVINTGIPLVLSGDTLKTLGFDSRTRCTLSPLPRGGPRGVALFASKQESSDAV